MTFLKLPKINFLSPKTATCKVYTNHYFAVDENDNFYLDKSGNLLCNPNHVVLFNIIKSQQIFNLKIEFHEVVYHEIKAGTIIIGN